MSGVLRRGADHITPYDRFAFSDVQLEHLLLSGELRTELTTYFGAPEYRELTRLARRAARLVPQGPTVIIVPGVMGSQLGAARAAPLPADILWLDPIDIQLGRLARLRLPGEGIRPLGVVLASYLRMKLQLRAGGFNAVFHDYDWRLGLEELARGLALRVRELSAPAALVAHSMGGLVCRAALGHVPRDQVARLILLGTPNAGSFAPVQALRGTYAVVRKLAMLSPVSSAEDMASAIFKTFPSLYQLLPRERCGGEMDLFDAGQWPGSGPQPDRELLVQARGAQGLLAPPDGRFVSIAGVGQDTVTGIARNDDDFVYTVTRHGDGTVPAVSAELPGAAQYYAKVTHNDLTRDVTVAGAVMDLLRRGSTRRLATHCRRATRTVVQVTDTDLRRTHVTKVDWSSLTEDGRRSFLERLGEPPQFRVRAPRKATTRRRRTASGS